MADRPITFSPAMVRALLAGTKTQTRRVILSREDIDRGPWVRVRAPHGDHGWQVGLERFNSWKAIPVRHAVGDRLYVREHWRSYSLFDHLAPRDLPEGRVFYIADSLYEPKSRFRQAMHMPKWASRITLHVTEVRVQRLQEISEEDAKAEGIRSFSRTGNVRTGTQIMWGVDGDETVPAAWSPTSAYRELWEHINGPDAWNKNPWVTATTFEVERCHIDQARAA